MKESELKTGRLSRLAGLVRAGMGMKSARDGAKLETTARLMGQMRGLATKVGQLASYVDGMVPEERRGLYESSLGTLQNAAASSSPAEIRALIEAELGAPVTELFASFEDEPIASASIGQVHRASTKDGAAVAVKVQHPGIVDAVESDLRNVGMLETLMKLGGTKPGDAKQLIADVQTRFREELDYLREADNAELFQRLHAEDDKVVVPAVRRDLTSTRVLTTDLVEGATFADACASPDEDRRRAWAETMWRFVHRSSLVAGTFNADPHPGNYIFLDDGKVCFLDFGCVQPLGETRRYWSAKVHEAAGERDDEAFVDATKKLFATRGGLFERLAVDYARHAFTPVFESPYRITTAFSGSLTKRMGQVAEEMRKNDNDGHVPMPEGGLFINRLQFGFFSVLARLDVEVDYAALDRGYLPRALAVTSS